MATQNYVVITSSQRTALMAYNGEDVAIDPRAVDNATPGVGININPDADGVAACAVVTLVGKFLAPKRIVDDAQYVTYAPEMVTSLLALPWAMLESETVFAPVVEI